VVAALTALFPIIVGTIAGLRAAGRNELRLMKALGASPWETLIKVRAKVALPFLFAGIETAVVLAVIGAVVGEFLGGSAGLGYLIVVANESLDISRMFATILLLSMFGLIMYGISVVIRRRVVFWVSDDRFSSN
jgi:NitT/TauT family transport system permease protein